MKSIVLALTLSLFPMTSFAQDATSSAQSNPPAMNEKEDNAAKERVEKQNTPSQKFECEEERRFCKKTLRKQNNPDFKTSGDRPL